ncbi:unnamed protein product [Notodromas monacha]|uniref:beta-galactoside alpha-(2,6)-sialyltransferase n=1 Tax=Notodromas monacha TaxID=399045 RepID=A0A7R9BQM2_9CRUS|nr:unnamed protein product [Notodromas monacha]CAG0919843.1 unnamed protein product [Notodromas monacha]
MFVNTMFLGMWCYVYILWAQYWKYAETHAPERKQRTPPRGRAWDDIDAAAAARMFPLQFSEEFAILEEPMSGNGSAVAVDRAKSYKTQLLVQLRNALLQEARGKTNRYGVKYMGKRLKLSERKSIAGLMCELKNEVTLRTLGRKDEPFKTTGMGKFFPEGQFLQGERFNSCAVVTNAGSLLGSNLDAHEVVMRFNHAPVTGFEKDVGTKTTFRVINSQIVSKPKFDFLNSPLYQNVSVLAWDPPKYRGSLFEVSTGE